MSCCLLKIGRTPRATLLPFSALYRHGLYFRRRRLRSAVQVFKAATAEHPQHAELFAALGDVYRQLGLLSAATQAGEHAVRLEPARALWRFHLASTYERLDGDKAETEWRRYLKLATNDAQEAQRLNYAHERLQHLERKGE